jgi:hypothetical protein
MRLISWTLWSGSEHVAFGRELDKTAVADRVEIYPTFS